MFTLPVSIYSTNPAPLAGGAFRGVTTGMPAAVYFGISHSPSLNLYCASGTNAISTSPNGSTWTARTIPSGAGTMITSCWGGGTAQKFIVANIGGLIAYSSDGTTWANGTAPSDQWVASCWSPDRDEFVVVGFVGRVAKSTDGINWTTHTCPNQNWSGVTWSPSLGLYVACARSASAGGIMTSPDGVTWTSRNSPITNMYAIAWSPDANRFVVVINGTGSVVTSTDGTTWNSLALPTGNQAYYHITYGGGLFVIVGLTGIILTSPDGLTWTQKTAIGSYPGSANIVYGTTNSSFVAPFYSGAANTGYLISP